MLRKLLYLSSALLLGAGALSGIQASGATFTDTSATPLNIFSAPDWTAPDVTIVDPGYAVTGTVTVNATASDSESADQERPDPARPARLEHLDHDLHRHLAPYSCSWDTTQVADGEYDLRAVATDAHANTKTSTSVMTTVQNTAGVVLDPVVGPVRGTGHADRHASSTPAGRLDHPVPGVAVRHQHLVRHPGMRRGRRPGPHLPGRHHRRSRGYYDWRAIGVINGNTYYDYRDPHHGRQHAADRVPDRARRTAERDGEPHRHCLRRPQRHGVGAVRVPQDRASPPGPPARSTRARRTPAASNTTALSDGTYEFRATATDVVGNTTTTATTTRDRHQRQRRPGHAPRRGSGHRTR